MNCHILYTHVHVGDQIWLLPSLVPRLYCVQAKCLYAIKAGNEASYFLCRCLPPQPLPGEDKEEPVDDVPEHFEGQGADEGVGLEAGVAELWVVLQVAGGVRTDKLAAGGVVARPSRPIVRGHVEVVSLVQAQLVECLRMADGEASFSAQDTAIVVVDPELPFLSMASLPK